MTDTQLLNLVSFMTDRFYGTVPDTDMLAFALADWRVAQARLAVTEALI